MPGQLRLIHKPSVLGMMLCALLLVARAAFAQNWIEVKPSDGTLYMTPGTWKFTGPGPLSGTVEITEPMNGRSGLLAGYRTPEALGPGGWMFVRQEIAPNAYRASEEDKRLLVVHMTGRSEQSYEYYIVTHVLYGDKDNKQVVGLMASANVNGFILTWTFERIK
jgi:hypothetical protein